MPAIPSQSQHAAARAFVRSLNVLLKSARLYGVAHGRTAEQTRGAWDEFQTLLKNGEGGVTFGVAGTQLLLDGAPLEDGPPERSFAELLSAAGLASLQFTPRVTAEDFARLISAFATAGGKVAGLAEHLKKTLAASGEATIRINEVRFVAEDAALGEGGEAGKLLAGSFGLQPGDIEHSVSDPQRLLQLIAAAQGAQSATGTQPTASAEPEGAASRDGWISSPASGPAREEDVLHLFRLVTGMAQASKSAEPQAVPITQQMGELSANAQQLFRQGLAALAKVAPAQRPDTPMLLQLAEHLAIRFALERFDRGEVKVNAVREMLERASGEMATLRKVLAVQEERMARAGLEVESHADVLDRQFWTTVPDSGKRAVLLSAEAWCIPPRNVRQFVEQLLQRGDAATAGSILENYTSCVGHEDAQVRLKVAAGLTDLAGLYARCAGRQLSSAVRCIADQMRWESDDKIRELLAGAYNRLAQEAATRRDYATLHMAMRCVETPVDGAAVGGARAMPQISIVDHLPELVDDALRSKLAPDLAAVLARTPQATADQAAARFAACTRRDQCQRLFGLFAVTGEKGVAHLSHLLRSGADTQAAATVGLLSQFAPATVEELLPLRLPQWNRSHHDTVVRQLGAAASPSRGRLLARIFTQLDKRVLPEAVDEIGMSQDTLRTSTLLLRLARGEAAQAADPLVRVKAIEALGRLRIAAIVPYLRSVLESRRMLGWEHHGEMRIVAAQALSRIDPQWMRDFRARSGLAAEQLALVPLDFSPDTPWARQRRYARVAPQRAVDAVAESARGDCKWNATLLSLGGGVATFEFPLPRGSQVAVKLRAGLRRVEAQALVRDTVKEQVGFEIVEMSLEERNKLRRLITGFQSHANPSRVLG